MSDRGIAAAWPCAEGRPWAEFEHTNAHGEKHAGKDEKERHMKRRNLSAQRIVSLINVSKYNQDHANSFGLIDPCFTLRQCHWNNSFSLIMYMCDYIVLHRMRQHIL